MKTNPINLETANLAQTAGITTCLDVARLWMIMSKFSYQAKRKKMYKARSYALLARACELDQSYSWGIRQAILDLAPFIDHKTSERAKELFEEV